MNTLMVVLAQASDLAPESPPPPVNTVGQLVLSATVVSGLVSFFLPLLVGIVTKAALSATWKGLLLLILNFISGTLVTATMADGTAVFSWENLLLIMFSFASAVMGYFGLWRSATASGTKLAPDFGVGPHVVGG